MTNKEILKKSIEKAIESRYRPTPNSEPVLSLRHGSSGCCFDTENENGSYLTINDIIFSHLFAEAFCKYIIKTNQINKLFDVTVKLREKEMLPEILYRIREKFLERLVVSRDRLKYIEKFLRKEEYE